jgi:molecular chaperone DnaK
MAADNKLLGQFDLIGIPPAPRGVPQIEVTFDIDANGIVHVSAKDMATSKEQSIRITASSGISKEEIERLVKDAQSHADEDKKRKSLAEARNEADTLVYSVEKSLGELGDKIADAERSSIQEQIAATKKALEGENVDAIRSAVQSLTQASHRLAEELYKKTSAGQPPNQAPESGGQPGPSEPPKDETVVDAEFEETDKDKKSPS